MISSVRRDGEGYPPNSAAARFVMTTIVWGAAVPCHLERTFRDVSVKFGMRFEGEQQAQSIGGDEQQRQP